MTIILSTYTQKEWIGKVYDTAGRAIISFSLNNNGRIMFSDLVQDGSFKLLDIAEMIAGAFKGKLTHNITSNNKLEIS